MFSFFNAAYYIYLVTVFIAGPFQYMPVAWLKLGVTNPFLYEDSLNKVYVINLAGLFVTNVSIYFFEIVRRKSFPFRKQIHKISNSISQLVCGLMLIAMYAGTALILAVYNDGKLPIITGNRNFYLNTSFSYFYQAFLFGITLCSMIYIYRIMYLSKGKLMLSLSVVFLIGSGTRANITNYVIYQYFLAFVYYKTRLTKNFSKKTTCKIIVACVFLLFLALWMLSYRNKYQDFSYIDEIMYGNTFCDIRDGAFMLRAFESKMDEFILGKTYFASFLSFLPSSISAYKNEWAWGRFSTYKLIGWSNHTGLRGGNSLEAYFNFGWIGVVLFSILKGYIFAAVEKLFYKDIYVPLSKHEKIDYMTVIPLWLLENIYFYLNISSNANTIYTFTVIILMNIFIKNIVGNKKKRNHKIFAC